MDPKNAHDDHLVKASVGPEEASYVPKRPLMNVIKVSCGPKTPLLDLIWTKRELIWT